MILIVGGTGALCGAAGGRGRGCTQSGPGLNPAAETNARAAVRDLWLGG